MSPNMMSPNAMSPNAMSPNMMNNPMMSNPMMNNPMMDNPMLSNPMMSNPMMSSPMMNNPMMNNPMMNNPMMMMNSSPFASPLPFLPFNGDGASSVSPTAHGLAPKQQLKVVDAQIQYLEAMLEQLTGEPERGNVNSSTDDNGDLLRPTHQRRSKPIEETKELAMDDENDDNDDEDDDDDDDDDMEAAKDSIKIGYTDVQLGRYKKAAVLFNSTSGIMKDPVGSNSGEEYENQCQQNTSDDISSEQQYRGETKNGMPYANSADGPTETPPPPPPPSSSSEVALATEEETTTESPPTEEAEVSQTTTMIPETEREIIGAMNSAVNRLEMNNVSSSLRLSPSVDIQNALNASEKAIVAVSSFVDLHKSPEKEEPKEEVDDDDDDDDDDVKEEVTAVNNVSEATLRRRRAAAAAAERRIKASSIKN